MFFAVWGGYALGLQITGKLDVAAVLAADGIPATVNAILGTLPMPGLVAAVIHVDPPTGPLWKSPANATLNRNKLIVQIDIKSRKDGRQFYVVCTSHKSHAKRCLKTLRIYDELVAEGLKALNPEAIFCQLDCFSGVRRGPRTSLAARAGQCCLNWAMIWLLSIF